MTHQVVTLSNTYISSSVLEKNLDALRRNNPEIASLVERIDSEMDDPNYPGWKFFVQTARNGQPTMVATDGNTEVSIHSSYDPSREASDQVNGVLSKDSRNYFVVLGFGLGYTVETLMKESGSTDNVLVVEPHLPSFKKAVETRDLSEILGDPRLVISFTPNVENAQAAFLARYSLGSCTGVGFVELSGRHKLPSNEFFSLFLERLKGVLITTGGNLQTLMLMAWTYQKNTMASIGHIVDHPPVRSLFGAFQDKPAIIVSAGPSLEKNISQLAGIRDRVVMIGVDTALRPLLASGVEPHLICTGDPQEANWRHLRGVKTEHAYLVAEPMTYSASIEMFKNRLFIASYEDKVMNWLHNYIPKVGHTLCWGSVATMAFDLARKMGCNPIIFVGQDLSYPGGRTYVKGTYFEDEEGQDMSVEAFEKKHIVYTLQDIYGNDVKTNRQMFAYNEWFRTEFRHTKSRVINATQGGILKDHCEIMDLEDVINNVLGESFDATGIIKTVSADFNGYDLAPLEEGLKENLESLKKSITICEKGIARIREILKTIEKMDTLPPLWCSKALAELDAMRFELMKEPSMQEFLSTANQTGVLNFQRSYRKLHGSDFSRVVFSEALDLFTNLFMSTGRTARGVLPFHFNGYRIICDKRAAGSIKSEEE